MVAGVSGGRILSARLRASSIACFGTVRLFPEQLDDPSGVGYDDEIFVLH